jgi:nucleoside-diphosphate-sugar epimerase
MSPVLVTGGSGYLGTQLIAALLRDGRQVRATVRSRERESDVRAAVRRGDADDSRLEVVTAELTADAGWAAAAAGCEEVHHVASPMVQSDDPDEVIVPARDGTLRVLRAARNAGVRRVVLTSSFAAVGYSPKPGAEYTEADWPTPTRPAFHRIRGPRRSPSEPPGTSSNMRVATPNWSWSTPRSSSALH